MIRSDNPKYQYEVELEDDDPKLFEDQLFKQGTISMNALFGTNSTVSWFFYLGAAPIAATRTWDAATGRYVPWRA